MRLRAALLLLAFPGVAAAALFGPLFAGDVPEGVGQGRLVPCPDTPNCVSSLADDERAIAPIPFRGDATLAMRLLASLATTLPGARIVTAQADYLHVEVSSRLMGFVDDLEAVPDAAASVIHVRSASRLGRSDFGVNRRRIERLRAAFVTANERGTPP